MLVESDDGSSHADLESNRSVSRTSAFGGGVVEANSSTKWMPSKMRFVWGDFSGARKDVKLSNDFKERSESTVADELTLGRRKAPVLLQMMRRLAS